MLGRPLVTNHVVTDIMKFAKPFLLLTVISLILLTLHHAVLRDREVSICEMVHSEDQDDRQSPNNSRRDATVTVAEYFTTTRSTELIHSSIMNATSLTVVTFAKAHSRSPEWYESVCKSPNCMDLLTQQERNRLIQCQKKAVHHVKHDLPESACRFVKGETTRSPVALNSQEGSGNTWLRGLLEKATGICTGFYACDPEMRARGFLGEGIQSGHVLVVKTHVHVPKWIGEKSSRKYSYESFYGSAVYLIRNPAHGMVAEWNRLVSNERGKKSKESHTNVISKTEFETDKWIKFSGVYLNRWKERTNNWVFNNHHHPVHVVSYEDLKRDTVGEVEKILDFLKFPYSHNELAERLRQNYTDFQRPHTNDNFQHFSPEQKENLRTTLLTVMATAKASGKSHLFHFDEYLDSLPHIK